MTLRHADTPLAIDAATAKTSKQRWTDALIQASSSVLLLRGGELVLYRRTRSLLYQCRFKLADGKWHRFSTRKASLENAIAAACDMYDEARYRQRLGLAHRTHTFAQIASITLAEMRQQIDLSTGKTAVHSYATCIEKYFLPYFGDKVLEEISHTDVREFELWRHLEWHTDKGVRYLRIWVDGKTGGRWLIAKHKAVEVLKRLNARQRYICELSFETTFSERVPHKLFRFSDGYQQPSHNGTFRRLIRYTGLLKNEVGQNRTLYSLRHTYATFELLRGGNDIHTLSKQMGNSAAMIERHYSKLTATMAADKLA
jgi:integrase